MFEASEIFNFAVRIEENGEMLYRKVAKQTKDPKVRKLFLFLAEEDVRHAGIFAKMALELKRHDPIEMYPGEYAAYMKAYTAEIIFPASVTEELPGAEDAIAALDFGIRRELDSIMYYIQVRELVPESQAKLIDKIIEEERGHFLKFSVLKRDYLAKKNRLAKRAKKR
ncbi:MAG: ferritin family protein [Kiritimatiellia bacterium]